MLPKTDMQTSGSCSRAGRRFFESSSRSIFLFEHDLFGKPVPTFPDHALEQAQLLPAAFRPREMIGGQLRTPLVEPELFAGDLEAAPDHPGHRSGAFHPRSPLRIVVAAAAHIADQ